jgi:hypothetical protein
MATLGVSLGPRTLETLIEEVGRLPGMVRELELSTARRAVHRVLAMIESHYQGLDRMVLSGGCAPWHLRRSMRRTGGGLRCLRPRDGRCCIKGSGTAATRRVRGSKSSQAPELNMPQTICNNWNTLPGYCVARLFI